jgi:molybdopterin molybdotransferase
MITPAEAEQRILAALPPAEPEDCPLAEAHGRVLRTGLRADRDLPPFDRATMDGYALRTSALAAGVVRFRIEAVQAAGQAARALGSAPDACVEIMTGAPLPLGADAVVPYEETGREDATMTVAAGLNVAFGHAVHRRGSDHRAGGAIVPAGTRLSGREIAVAAACGYATLAVSRQPRVAVVSTGDELVEVGAAVAAHQIRRSNDYALRAALLQSGYPAVERFHVGDGAPAVAELLGRVLADYDVILLTGGVSRGKFDLIPAELERQGVRKVLHGVAQRPGKPLWFGVGPRSQPVFALPGNPVSAYLCLHRYVLPGLAAAAGLPRPPLRRVALGSPFVFRPKMTRFLPVTLIEGPPGVQLAVPVPGNTSGDFAGLVGTAGFVELPPDEEEFPAGWPAPFRPWA